MLPAFVMLLLALVSPSGDIQKERPPPHPHPHTHPHLPSPEPDKPLPHSHVIPRDRRRWGKHGLCAPSPPPPPPASHRGLSHLGLSPLRVTEIMAQNWPQQHASHTTSRPLTAFTAEAAIDHLQVYPPRFHRCAQVACSMTGALGRAFGTVASPHACVCKQCWQEVWAATSQLPSAKSAGGVKCVHYWVFTSVPYMPSCYGKSWVGRLLQGTFTSQKEVGTDIASGRYKSPAITQDSQKTLRRQLWAHRLGAARDLWHLRRTSHESAVSPRDNTDTHAVSWRALRSSPVAALKTHSDASLITPAITVHVSFIATYESMEFKLLGVGVAGGRGWRW